VFLFCWLFMLLHEFYLWIIYGQFTGIYVEKNENKWPL